MEGYNRKKWQVSITPNKFRYLWRWEPFKNWKNWQIIHTWRMRHGGRIAKYSLGQLNLGLETTVLTKFWPNNHDIEVMPNGKYLVICLGNKDWSRSAWNCKNPIHQSEGLARTYYRNWNNESPKRKIVWEGISGSYIQDLMKKNNFGNVTQHPNIDINFLQSIDMDITHFNKFQLI